MSSTEGDRFEVCFKPLYIDESLWIEKTVDQDLHVAPIPHCETTPSSQKIREVLPPYYLAPSSVCLVKSWSNWGAGELICYCNRRKTSHLMLIKPYYFEHHWVVQTADNCHFLWKKMGFIVKKGRISYTANHLAWLVFPSDLFSP